MEGSIITDPKVLYSTVPAYFCRGWPKVLIVNLTNVTVTVGLLASIKGGPSNLPLKFGQRQVGSVTAEIFRIWTNVTRTNIAYIEFVWWVVVVV